MRTRRSSSAAPTATSLGWKGRGSGGVGQAVGGREMVSEGDWVRLGQKEGLGGSDSLVRHYLTIS